MKPSIKEFTKIDGNTTSCSINGIKANAQIRVEQDAGLVLKNVKLKILCQPHDDVLLTTDSRFNHYKANEGRIILKDGLLFRKYYGETDSVKYYQILIPKQLVNEVLRSLPGEFGKHPGITRTIIAYREKYCYPKRAQWIREWVMSCQQCLRESLINPRLTHLALQNPNEYNTAPEDAMQIDFVPGLPTSHAIMSHGTAFMSHVIKEVAGVLGITLKHATRKHAQKIVLLERSHASIKQALKMETGERKSLWLMYVSIAVLNYNMSYHASIECEPSRVYHGRIASKILDLKTGIRSQKTPYPD